MVRSQHYYGMRQARSNLSGKGTSPPLLSDPGPHLWLGFLFPWMFVSRDPRGAMIHLLKDEIFRVCIIWDLADSKTKEFFIVLPLISVLFRGSWAWTLSPPMTCICFSSGRNACPKTPLSQGAIFVLQVQVNKESPLRSFSGSSFPFLIELITHTSVLLGSLDIRHPLFHSHYYTSIIVPLNCHVLRFIGEINVYSPTRLLLSFQGENFFSLYYLHLQ